jgi:mono/diheme cytochrome c family protein
MSNALLRRNCLALGAIGLGVTGVLLCGCQQKMADQPSLRPLETSRFFSDGRSARPPVPGTVSQGPLREGRLWFTGYVEGGRAEPLAQAMEHSLGGKPLGDYSTQFPFPIAEAELDRGKERYTIYCAVCHGPIGQGDGIVVQRGFTKPPSYITDDSRGLALRGIKMPLREVPVGYLFEVPTKGFGAMADYADMVPARDRWAIVAYIRTLQLSQHLPLEQLPVPQRQAAQDALEAAR